VLSEKRPGRIDCGLVIRAEGARRAAAQRANQQHGDENNAQHTHGLSLATDFPGRRTGGHGVGGTGKVGENPGYTCRLSWSIQFGTTGFDAIMRQYVAILAVLLCAAGSGNSAEEPRVVE
jgi:hypothetical protein